jgi:hypothetical protein
MFRGRVFEPNPEPETSIGETLSKIFKRYAFAEVLDEADPGT